MKKYFAVIFIVIIVVMFSYLNTFSATVEKSLSKKNVEFSKIVAEVELKEGILVYYYDELNQSYASSLVTKSIWGYKWFTSFGNWSTNNQDEIVWMVSNRQVEIGYDFDFYIAQGIFNNEKIEKILISPNRDNEREVTNIVKGELVNFWYYISDTPLDGGPDLLGLSKDNVVIYNLISRSFIHRIS